MATGDELKKAGATKYVRGSCTDQRLRSSECPQFCIDPNVDNLNGGSGIGKCLGATQDMYYCIDSSNTDNNCSATQNPLIFKGGLTLMPDRIYILIYARQPSALTTVGVTATHSTATKSATRSSSTKIITTTLSTTVKSASASPTQTATTPQSTSADHTAAITAGVAAPLGVIALGIGTFLYYRYGRKRNNSKLSTSEYQAVPPPTYHDEAANYAEYGRNPKLWGSNHITRLHFKKFKKLPFMMPQWNCRMIR